MRSFILNQSNDLRLNALVKQQELEHQHLISGHHKEMQDLRDALKLAMERFESISKRNDQDLKGFKEQTDICLNILKNGMLANEAIIADQRKMITDLHKQMMDLRDVYSTKTESETMKSQVQTQMTNASQNQKSSLDDYQRATNAAIASLKDDVTKLRADMDLKLAQVAQKAASDISIATIEKEGVLKELIRYKKDIFIIEKKIEDLYTRVEGR